MYDVYKDARDKSWEVLLRCAIKELPVDLGAIADYYKIKVVLYSKTNIVQAFEKNVNTGDGFITNINQEKHIFINDRINNRFRRRFTLAHELGHGILEHDLSILHFRNSEIDSQTDIQEAQANVFARDILMPATVLAALNIHTPEQIMKLCHISYESARIRAERMKELYQRNMFNRHPLERAVRKQFDPFIKKMLNK